MVVGESWVIKHLFQGVPNKEDFELVREDLGDLTDGEIAFVSEYISVDPYQRAYTSMHKVGQVMLGSSVAKVTESKDPNFPVGCRVVLNTGWRKSGKFKAADAQKMGLIRKASDIMGLSPSYLLGSCGMPGNTAYFGFLDICQPKEGEVVLVNGAGGAVGSLVGQIAKLKGCKVIGYAGSDEKVQWLKELGFDHAFNYKKIGIAESIKQAAPEGIDCFFDNVGGPDTSVILAHMNRLGRVSVCGAISGYNEKEKPMVPAFTFHLVQKELTMRGFIVASWLDQWEEGIAQMAKWIKEGKIKVRETIFDGFEKTPEAFIGLFTGQNFGKMIVKC